MTRDAFADETNVPSPEQLLAAIVESSEDAIIGKDLDGTITTWNYGAQRLYGYTSAEVLGHSIMLLIPEEKQEEETRILRRVAKGERIEHFETVRVAKDGRLVDISLTISPIKNAAGTVIGASKIARDISEQKRTERALQEALRQLKLHADNLERIVDARTAELRENLAEMETFSSSLSHDLKAPLRAILGYARVLQEEEGISDAVFELGKKIETNAGRLQHFIQDVMAYARLGRGLVELQPIDLGALMPRILEEHPYADQANAEVKICQPLLTVQGNEMLLTHAIANLLSNGVKFVEPGTRAILKIWTEKRGRQVRFWVEDNGIGIPKEERENVFKLFTRLTSQSAYEGTGVGLAIVQRAVAKMGGTTGVESRQGKGSRFWIQLRASG